MGEHRVKVIDLAGARAEQRGTVVASGGTQDAANTLNRLGPWLNVYVTGEDPEVARGRAKLQMTSRRSN